MKRIFLALPLLLALFCGCRQSESLPDEKVETVMLFHTFQRLNTTFSSALTPSESVAINAFMQYRGYSSIDSMMADPRMSLALRSFGPLVQTAFSDTASLSRMAQDIASRASEAGINLASRRYVFVIWNDTSSMAFVDSMLLIALNHYLGADCPYYKGFPQYQLVAKTPEQLPLDIAEAQVASTYPFIGKTALARMAYEGVLAIARQRLTGCTEAQALGYTDSQWQDITEQAGRWWRQMASLKLIYTSDQLAIDQLVMPAPYTAPFGIDAPPRLGRYFGYEIVCAWLNRHGDKPLAQLHSPDFYANDRLLVESGYNPQ